MDLVEVTSTNVRAVGYDPAARVLRVVFRNGGTYDYSDVSQALFEAMCEPFPWRRLGREVRSHPTRRVS